MGTRRLFALGAVALAATALFAYRLHIEPDRPGVTDPAGWYLRFDQGAYLREARALAHGHMPPKRYVYGPGYPMLAVPAIRLGAAGDPFAPADALCFAAAAVLVVLIGEQLRSLRFGVAAAAALALASPLLALTVEPWSSTVTLVGVLVALYAALRPQPATIATGIVLGVSVAEVFAARYIDAIPVAVIAAVALLPPTWRSAWRPLAAAGAAGALGIGAVLWSHQHVFGNALRSPYHQHKGLTSGDARDDQLGAYDVTRVPARFVGEFVNGRDHGRRMPGDPILAQMPWLVVTPVGMLLLWRRRHRARVAMLVATVASVVWTIVYLSFRQSGAAALQFHSDHYFKAWYPLWCLLAALAFAEMWQWLGRASRAPDQ